MSTLERAIALAAKAHEGQVDKAGEPYVLHPLRVMLRLTTTEERIAAVLHDVIEDCDWSLDQLRAESFTSAVVDAIDSLTRQQDESYEAFVVRAAANPIARQVKLADLQDNCDLSRIAHPTERDYKRTEKYRRAIALIQQIDQADNALGGRPMPNPGRIIRVFISSTFRDMKEERNYLVKFIFPQLRKLCEQRGVTWGEVDLRWGIADEQKAEGKVLPICLEEIQRCRPYFIGLLGERYGWVPEEISHDLIAREPWLAEHRQHSVTELEILHGVLRDPAMANHAFFYFRSPSYIESLPSEQREDFLPEEEASAEKLRVLKHRIRASGFLVWEDYPNPKALGELVLKDLTDVIDQLFPEEEKINPLDRDAAEHEAFAVSRTRVYIGRKEYFDCLDAHAAGDGLPLVVPGESGSGKSALIANWLHMTAAKGRVVLILDALNQLEDRDGAPDLVWLPPVIPANVRLILSTLPGRPLDDLRKRGWPTIKVKPLDTSERQQLIIEYLAHYTKTLPPVLAERIAQTDQSANPLYLRALLEELRIYGDHFTLRQRIDYYLPALSVKELYEKILARWEEDYEGDTDLVGDSLSLIWASRRGLTETELLELLGNKGEPLPRAQWSPFYLAADQSLVSRSGLLGFSHDYLRDAVRDAYIPTEKLQDALHLRLADYFAAKDLGFRTIDELPWQLTGAKSWQRLYDLLADMEFFSAAWRVNEYEVKAYWVQVENHSLLGKTQAYRSVLEAPERVSDNNVWFVAALLADMGHPAEALTLREHLVERFRQTGDRDNLQITLWGQANILYTRGDLDGAMALHKEVERICRELGNKDRLQSTLGNQANILYTRGDLDEAMALFKEVERLCRELGDVEGLAISLTYQATLIADDMGRQQEALSQIEEAYRLATDHGLVALAQKIRLILDRVQSQQSLTHNDATTKQKPQELERTELIDVAERSYIKGNWEAAETLYCQLLDKGEPIEIVVPKIITCIFNTHPIVTEGIRKRIEGLIQKLESADKHDVAEEVRKQLHVKDAQSHEKKSKWKFWK